MRCGDEAGDQHATARAAMPLQGHHVPTDHECGSAFDDGIDAVARDRTGHAVTDTRDPEPTYRMRGGCRNDFPAVRSRVAQANDR